MQGKVALVTGGSTGIGFATALAFARERAKVVVADVNVEDGRKTVNRIKESGGDAVFLQADVSQPAQVEVLINKTVETYGRLDSAFNNAGIGSMAAPTHEYSMEDWVRTININLTGVWLCMKYEIIQMLKQGGGAIVNTSSAAGLVGYRGGSAYAAAKHGVNGLTKTAALEYAPEGIRVNAVCPGLIRTRLVERIIARGPEVESRLLSQVPNRRIAAPEEIAEVVVWLCSDAASLVTGVAMPVDGGLVAQSIGPLTTKRM